MIKVSVTQTGQDLTHLERDTRNKLTRRIGGVLTAGVTTWRKIVITSTWFSPVPSPTSMIVGFWRKTSIGYVFVHGWINYRGDDARAEWRKSLRDAMFQPRLLEQIAAIVNSSLGPVGGRDPGQGSGGV